MTQWSPFVTTGLDIDDPYSLVEYANNAQHGDCAIQCLFDRNLISSVCHLSKGDSIPNDEGSAATYRMAAGCMAYMIVANATIDPAIAEHEFADSTGARAANHELFLFRIADHIHPRPYVEIALGLSDKIPRDHLQNTISFLLQNRRPGPEHDLDRKLEHHTLHRMCLTKLVLIAKGHGSPTEKMISFLRWSFREALSNAAAITFAKIFLGRNRPAGMIKGIDAEDPNRCLRGIRNAAWDLVYLSDWGRTVEQDDELKAFLLCSGDAALRSLADGFCAPRGTDELQGRLKLLRAGFGERNAAEINAFYEAELARAVADPVARQAELDERPPADVFLRSLEHDLLSTWV